MIRILLLALTLTACGCMTAPIAPDAQAQLNAIHAMYVEAAKIEKQNCPHKPACNSVRSVGYEAESAYVTADNQRTAASIDEANAKVIAFKDAAEGLK